MSWVFEFSESRGTDRLVLLAIAHRVSNDDGEAFPSVKRISTEANISERAVHYSIQALARSGEIAVKLNASRYKTNVYCLPKFNAWVQTLHPPVQTVQGVRVQSTTKKGANLAPESSENHHKIKSPPLPPVNCDGGHQKLLSAKTCGELQLQPPTQETQAPVNDPFANDGFEYLYWAGRWFQIDMNGRKRLMTESERSGMSGCRAEQMLTFLHRKGFKARMMDDSELSYPSAQVAYTASPAIPGQNRN